jgi:hypothetical protein
MNPKIKEWLIRYLPANLFCTACTLITAYITFSVSQNRALTAFLSSIIGTICYYGFIIARDIIYKIKKCHLENKKYSLIHFLKGIRNIILEFGFAEALDSLVIAPFFMYIIPILVGNLTIGIFIAKCLADIVFYMPTIIVYELRKKYLKD